jgi:site-specific recombinase XerD
VIGKGNKKRTVFFSRQTAAALSNYLRREERKPNDAVFINGHAVSKGSPLTVTISIFQETRRISPGFSRLWCVR